MRPLLSFVNVWNEVTLDLVSVVGISTEFTTVQVLFMVSLRNEFCSVPVCVVDVQNRLIFFLDFIVTTWNEFTIVVVLWFVRSCCMCWCFVFKGCWIFFKTITVTVFFTDL